MVTWEIFPDGNTAEEWDALLENGSDAAVFQSHGWGEYKRAAGWAQARWVAKDKNGSVAAMVQAGIKSFPGGVKMGWSPGGPVFCFPPSKEQELSEMMQALFDEIKKINPKMLLRFHSHLQTNAAQSYSMSHVCHRPFFRFNTGYSVLFDLSLPADALMKKMTSKHRYYVKKALTVDMEWKTGNNETMIQELAALHTEMATDKKMERLKSSAEDMKNMCRHLGKNALLFSGYVNGEAVTSCMVLTFGKRAFYMMAATGKKGRETSAAYAMVYKLFDVLKEKGIAHFDFAGIDPKSPAAAGVNHFKKGFGGELIEHLGEWEWATSEKLRWALNLAIWKKGGRV